MASEADFKQECPPQSWEHLKTLIRTRISVWIGTALFVGWVLLRFPPKNQRTYESGSIQDALHRSGEIKPDRKSKQRKEQGGLLSLVLELLGAVAISLVQRYFKSWRSTLIVKLHNPPEPKLSSADVPRKATPIDDISLPDHRSETSPEKAESEKPYQKSTFWRLLIRLP